jgi:hypothetical protein
VLHFHSPARCQLTPAASSQAEPFAENRNHPIYSITRSQEAVRRDQADAFLRHNAVGGVARREDQRPRPEIFVDDRMDFAVAAAFGWRDRLKFGPPFPPLAKRRALTWELSNATCSSGSDSLATVSNIFCQIPRSLQRTKRL